MSDYANHMLRIATEEGYTLEFEEVNDVIRLVVTDRPRRSADYQIVDTITLRPNVCKHIVRFLTSHLANREATKL